MHQPSYRFRRTDEDLTRVEVGRMDRSAPAISPRIYSNFLEHLGGTVYEALWANVVYNPQFGADRRGELVRWSLSDGAEWLKTGLAGHSLSLPVGGEARQLVAVPAQREHTYRGSLWARTPDGKPARVEIALRRADKPAVIAAAALTVKGENWKRHTFTLTLPENALERGEPTELRLTGASGDANLAMVEIFPADAVDGVDPQVLAAAKALHIELLRWPGGNFVSGYHWRDGVGPKEKRPTEPNPAWGGLETHHFGTDEFMRFCKRIGTRPQICVNAGNGTPEEAAEWVQYCNGGTDTPMGRLRAENGHPEPYNVRVWEIGNELYGNWQIGHTDPEGNAARYLRFRRAMLAADPTIEIIATGKGDGMTPGGIASDRAWNLALLSAICATDRAPQYLSLHPLVSLPDGAANFSYREVYDSAMAHPQWWEQTYVPALYQMVQEKLGPNSGLRCAPTEWGIIIGGPNWLRFPNHDSQAGAIYAALFFHAMFRAGDFVGLSNITGLMHGGGIKRYQAQFYVDPMYYISRMYGTARLERLLPTEVDGPGYDVPQRAFLPAEANVPWLDVVAGEAKDGAKWLFVVNRDPDRARRAEISLPWSVRSAEVETLAAPPETRNSPDHPDTDRSVRSTLAIGGTKLAHEFPACSVTALRLR